MSEVIIVRSSVSKLSDGSLKSNLGDLLRCTVLLECIGSSYSWYTDSKGAELLRHFIDSQKIKLMTDATGSESKDTVIYCLDNFPSVNPKQFGSSVTWKGFVPRQSEWVAENDLIASLEPYRNAPPRITTPSYQEALIRGLGFSWQEQDFALPLSKPVTSVGVGLNWQVHSEWPSKQWPRKHWDTLFGLLTRDCTVSWQPEGANLDAYINWISGCRLVVTAETLGLHLASAMRKTTIALVGPITEREYPYDRVSFMRPRSRDCMPCDSKSCRMDVHCMDELQPSVVSDTVLSLLLEDD